MTLAEAFGPDVAYVRRPAPSAGRWLPKEPGVVDFISGGQNAIAGAMPVVCCAATLTPDAVRCLRDAGFAMESEFHPCATLREYRRTLDRLATSGLRFALQTPHSPDEVDPRFALVDPDIQRDLNDKGRLAEHVPPERIAPRCVVAPALATGIAVGEVRVRGAVVLKAANRLPSGAGESVRICRSEAAVRAALSEMADEPGVVVEEFLAIRASACFHSLVRRDGSVEFLGVAEQVCDAHGHYRGNWIDAGSDLKAEADVVETVRRAVEGASALGYRGFSGIDVAFTGDGDWRVLDLNFRMNGSTPAVLLRRSIEASRGPVSIRSRSWRGDSDFPALLATVRAAMGRGALIPLVFYDPAANEAGGAPRVGGLLVGPDRETVAEEDLRLAREGLA